MRLQALRELVATEIDYVRDLELIVKVFSLFLPLSCSFLLLLPPSPLPPLSLLPLPLSSSLPYLSPPSPLLFSPLSRSLFLPGLSLPPLFLSPIE